MPFNFFQKQYLFHVASETGLQVEARPPYTYMWNMTLSRLEGNVIGQEAIKVATLNLAAKEIEGVEQQIHRLESHQRALRHLLQDHGYEIEQFSDGSYQFQKYDQRLPRRTRLLTSAIATTGLIGSMTSAAIVPSSLRLLEARIDLTSRHLEDEFFNRSITT